MTQTALFERAADRAGSLLLLALGVVAALAVAGVS
jgi:hypothetical protein